MHHRHLEMSHEVVEETLLILQENLCDFLLELDVSLSRWMFSVPDLLQGVLIRPSAIGKNKFSIFFGKYHLFRTESFRVDFRCVHRFQLLNVCNFQIPPAYKAYSRNNPGNIFFPNCWILDWSCAEIV